MPGAIPLPPPKNKCQWNGNRLCGAQYALQEQNALNHSKIESFMIRPVCMTLYTTSHLSMIGLTFVIGVAEESLFKHQQSTQQ